ncbi:hypothetical protein REPUB_Repub19eG0030700 [Reevesia pubescens]
MFSRWSNSRHDQDNDSSQHESKVKELRAALGPLSGRSLKYCTDACLRRYLEAFAVEGETGKIYRANFHDGHGRTVLILRPGKQNTTALDNQQRHLVYLLENAILNLPEGQEQMAWLIDFTGWTLSTSVPIKSARDTVNVLQNHYPERLAIAFLYNPPRIFEAFWKIVKYFLDAKTFQKVKFVYPKNKDSVELMKSYFDEENLTTEFGGKAILEYNHEEFSKQMIQDDIKSANLWGFDDKLQCVGNGHSGPEVAPEPVSLAPPAS